MPRLLRVVKERRSVLRNLMGCAVLGIFKGYDKGAHLSINLDYGVLGRLAITTEEMLSNEAIAHFKKKAHSSLSPEFLYLFLKTFKFETLGSTSSIVEAINSQMIKEIGMLVPDVDTLKDFKELIEPCFSKIRRNSIQTRTLTRLRDALLPKLMSGEVRVELSETEPATVND